MYGMSEALDLSDKRVLIIEDQKAFQVMLKGLLINLGAKEVDAKRTGEAGIAAYARRPYDILLVDYNLGRGKNGRQVLEELRQRGMLKPETLFFIITGDNTRPMVLSALELQPDDYLTKPFSHRVLRARLLRAYKRRMWLRDVFKSLYNKDYEQCIEACQKHINAQSRYAAYCQKLQIELFNKTDQLDAADNAIEHLLDEGGQSWARLKQAETRLLQQRPDDALELIAAVIKKMPNAIEAHDLKTRCFLSKEAMDDALDSARIAITMAPFSIERQTLLARIARDSENYEIAKQAMNNVLQIARTSVHRNVQHLCNYLRAILDAAEHAETRQQIAKYQTEATMELQRARFDENLVYSDISFETIESILLSRIDAFNGRLREAQSRLNQIFGDDLAAGNSLPEEVSFDVVAILMDLGEFEKADDIVQQYQQLFTIDEYTQRLMRDRASRSEQRRTQFRQMHERGIQEYEDRRYKEALNSFREALKMAPLNSGAALNFIQAAVRYCAEANSDNEIGFLKKECLSCLRTLQGMTLTASHAARYEQLIKQTARFNLS